MSEELNNSIVELLNRHRHISLTKVLFGKQTSCIRDVAVSARSIIRLIRNFIRPPITAIYYLFVAS